MIAQEKDDTLLIEPVWNRNGLELDRRQSEALLLIEPVWNRNGGGTGNLLRLDTATFNRTSLESKWYQDIYS